jgi:hypothetical protein
VRAWVTGRVAVRPTVERISLTSADATFAFNVPMTIASMRKVRRSNLRIAPQPANVALESSGGAHQSQRAASALRSVTPQLTQTKQSVQQPAPPRRRQRVAVGRGQQLAAAAPIRMRTKVVLGATIAAVFLVTTLTRNLFDANAYVTRDSAPRPEIAQPDIPASPLNSDPAGLTHAFRPAPSAARRAEPRPDATQSDVEPADPQMAASTVPIADPSTFGSEAYEPIYSN